MSGTKVGGTKAAAAGEGKAERCLVIASVESSRADASTINATTPARHFESAVLAPVLETVDRRSGYEAQWPMTI
jgi:hypothetical protein